MKKLLEDKTLTNSYDYKRMDLAFTAGGIFLKQEGKYKDALKMFKTSSMLGAVEADYQLGVMYFNGEGTKVNRKMAYFYFRRACEKGHLLSMWEIAKIHMSRGSQDDIIEAIVWFNELLVRGNFRAGVELLSILFDPSIEGVHWREKLFYQIVDSFFYYLQYKGWRFSSWCKKLYKGSL